MLKLWTVVIVVAWVSRRTDGQQNFGACPLQWEFHEGSCYQFVFNPAKTYEEASSACWVQGSALVSVDTISENQFIQNFLNSHGQGSFTKWYTSGRVMARSIIKWDGDGTFTNDTSDDSLWVYPNYLFYDFTGDRIVYSYSSQSSRYGWSTETGTKFLNYICEIPKGEIRRIVQQTRDFNFGNSNTTEKEIPKGPQFLTVPQNEVIIDSEIPMMLDCMASGHPQPSYSWFVSNPRVENNFATTFSQIQPDNRYTLSNGRLTISKPQEQTDAGTYQCKASNTQGSVLSPPVLVSFGYLNQFSPNQQGFVTALQMQGSYITCRAPSAKPALGYQWYKDNIRNFIRPELNKYFFISNNGNLYFSEVQDTDRGNYYCVVTLIPRVGEILTATQSISRTSKAIELRIQGSPSLDYGPIIHPDFIAVYPKPPLVGHDVRLECFAYGRLPLVYSWTRDGGKAFPLGTTFTYDNRVMVIPNATFSDGGNYTCKVVKITGQQSIATKSVFLTLEAKPYFVHPLRNMHADVGSELTWRCEARAVPRATYTWYKNSKVLVPIPGQVTIRTNVLVIKSLDKSRDEGMYQCAAHNAHGTSMMTAQLRVLSIAPNFQRYPLPSSMAAAEGGNLTIRCLPEAAPQPTITWTQNGQEIGYGDGGGRRMVMMDGTLRVTQVSFADQGLYTCKAENGIGSAQSQTSVSITSGVRFQTQPANSEGYVNNTVFLYCEASYDFNKHDLTYIWTFNGHIIDTENSFFYHLGNRGNIHGLYIRNAQYYHTGQYQCIPQTVTTSITAQAFVEIKGPPAAPAGAYIDHAGNAGSNNSTARVVWTWNPEANHGFPVVFFDIEAKTNYSNKWAHIATDIPAPLTVVEGRDMVHYYDVKNLLPANLYNFRILAKNDQGVGPPSRQSNAFHVGRAAPVRWPLHVSGGGGSVGTLTITWQPLKPEEEGGTGFGYKVFWQEHGSARRSEWGKAVVGRVTKHTVTLTIEDYFLLYDVKVQAFNVEGDGPMSPISQVYTAEGMPRARPTNVKYNAINGTAVEVAWQPVPSTRVAMKGEVLGFQVDYINSNNKTHVQNNQNRMFVYCQCSSAIIIGLQPNQNYWVDVLVFNSAGRGTPSEKYLVSTYENPIGRFPQFVDVYTHGPHSALVKWRGVNVIQGESKVYGYRLLYWPVSSDIRTANFTLTEDVTETVLYGLQHDIIYKLRIMGVNRGGDGKKSPTVYFTVTESGSININRANFDPATSQFLMASAGYQSTNILLMVFCVLFQVFHQLFLQQRTNEL